MVTILIFSLIVVAVSACLNVSYFIDGCASTLEHVLAGAMLLASAVVSVQAWLVLVGAR